MWEAHIHWDWAGRWFLLNPFLLPQRSKSSPLRGGEFFGLCSNSFFIFYSVLAGKGKQNKKCSYHVALITYSNQEPFSNYYNLYVTPASTVILEWMRLFCQLTRHNSALTKVACHHGAENMDAIAEFDNKNRVNCKAQNILEFAKM